MTRLATISVVAGVLGAAATALLAADDPGVMAAAWLTPALGVLGLGLGALTILMIHLLTGGAWGMALRPPLRALVATLPLSLALLLPVFGAFDDVFPWTKPPEELTEIVRKKLPYLDPAFFAVRFAACSAAWVVLAWLVLGWTAPERGAHRGGAAAGLIIQALAVTVLSIDWMLSLEPEYHSTIYPMLEISAQIAGAYALAMLVVTLRRPVTEVSGGAESVLLSEDLANLLLGFVVIWIYLAYMQYLITWAADLPIEIHWYLDRSGPSWLIVLWALVLLHGLLPVALCLARSVKRSRSGAVVIAGAVLAGHFLDVAWRIRPALTPQFGWHDLAAAVGALGLFSALFLVVLGRIVGRPILRRSVLMAEWSAPEKRDVAPRPVVIFAAGLAAFIIVAGLALRLVLGPAADWPAPGPAAEGNRATPALQVAPAEEREALQAAAEAELRAFAWVDREAGLAAIPISAAMELVAERGLPNWGGDLADDSDECRLLTATVPRAPQAARCWAPEAGQ